MVILLRKTSGGDVEVLIRASLLCDGLISSGDSEIHVGVHCWA